MSVHSGHRQRLKERFLREGLDQFEEHQVLELLLFYCIPRKDTNPIAHALISRFGSLTGVLDAPVEELQKVPEIGENAALFLSLLSPVCRYYMVNHAQQNKILPRMQDCWDYMIPLFHGRRNEIVYLLCLDAKCKMICCRELGEGSVNSASVPIRKIVECALTANASTVVLAHNHPSGLAIPSQEDIQATYRVASALEAVDIILEDHIVVADDDFVSLRESGIFDPGVTRSPLGPGGLT